MYTNLPYTQHKLESHAIADEFKAHFEFEHTASCEPAREPDSLSSTLPHPRCPRVCGGSISPPCNVPAPSTCTDCALRLSTRDYWGTGGLRLTYSLFS
eukprot:jgi/Botrbrau1/19816/Bobra.0124s0058.2